MTEAQKIIGAIDAAVAQGLEGNLFLATVVDVVGSSYRRPSARMLVLPDGRHVGSISGGCLERDLCSLAPRLASEKPALVSFDTRSEITDSKPRYNLGCSGILYVLVERVTGGDGCPSAPLREVEAKGQPRTVATVYGTDGSGPAPGAVGERCTLEGAPEALREVFEKVEGNGLPVCVQYVDGENTTRVFVERLDPPRPLWVFGSGDDASPLVAMAKELGWAVEQIDPQPGRIPARLHACPRTAAVLMTHSFDRDAALLPSLLASPACYVGVLGPKSRTGKLMAKLHADAALPDPDLLDRLKTPVGLDIGARLPAEIAVSVLAEIIANDNRRDGAALRGREGPIHEPVAHEVVECQARPQSSRPTGR